MADEKLQQKGARQGTESPFLGVQPQQNLFEFGPIRFDSRFDSGNLAKVVVSGPSSVRVPGITCGSSLT